MPGRLSDRGHASLQEPERLPEGSKEALLQGVWT